MALPIFSRGAFARARALFPRVFPPGVPVLLGLLAVLVTATVLLVAESPDPSASASNAVTSANSDRPVAMPGPGSAAPEDTVRLRGGDPPTPDSRETAAIADESAASTAKEPGRERAGVDGAGPGDSAALAETAGDAAEDDGEDPDRPELAIAGAVLDDRGHLLPGITVAAVPAALPGNETGDGRGAGMSGVTDANGMFRFEGVAEGEYVLSVAASAQHREARLTVRAGVESAELRLQRIRAVTVRGQVTAPSARALPGVSVRVLGERAAVTTDAAGRYEVVVKPAKAGQPPVLAFTLDGYRESRQRVNASEADTVDLDVRLEPSEMNVALSGSIMGPRSEPVAGARVWLSSADPVSYRQTTSNEHGEYRFEEVEIGDFYRAGVEPVDGYEPHVSELFAVGPDDTVHSIQLAEGGDGRLSGQLVDPQGNPLAGFLLWLDAPGGGGGSHLIQSDGNGNFSAQQVPSGTLTLHTESQPLLQATGIELLPGESRHVLVPLDWGPHWLFGQVVDQDARPVAGARIVLQWSQQFPDVHSVSRREVSSDRLGYFTFSNLGAGDHVLTVTAPGYGTARDVYDPRFAASDMRIALQHSGGSGAGGGE